MKTGLLHVWVLLFSLIAFLASGCGSRGDAGPDPLPEQENPVSVGENENHNHAEDAVKEPDKDHAPASEADKEHDSSSDKEKGDSEGRKGKDSGDENDLAISSSNDEDKDEAKKNSGKPERQKPESDETHTYDASLPKLAGIAVGDSKSYVMKRFGNPRSAYVMEDEAGELEVFQYDSFTVGFDPENKVEFIDITSEKIDPGLNGLRLGDRAGDAIRLLGEPDVKTEYVLNYVSETAILKLDIDPFEERINSIKLFAAE